MRTETINIYKFEELSEEVQEKVIDSFRDDPYMYAWETENRETLEEFENLFGINVYDWDYDIHSYNYSWNDDLSEEKLELSGTRLLAWIWNNYKKDLFKPKFICKYVSTGIKSRYSKCQIEACCVLTGYHMDEMILKPIYDLWVHKYDKNFGEVIEECLDSFFQACVKDMEYSYSSEAIKEHIEANEYEFTENGELY